MEPDRPIEALKEFAGRFAGCLERESHLFGLVRLRAKTDTGVLLAGLPRAHLRADPRAGSPRDRAAPEPKRRLGGSTRLILAEKIKKGIAVSTTPVGSVRLLLSPVAKRV